jgi:transcription antitermination factor NusG
MSSSDVTSKDAPRRWYACRTRSRAEKKVFAALEGRAVESYLPLVPRDREWADRVKRVHFPIFPGYVFARFEMSGMGLVLQVPGLTEVVGVEGRPIPVADDELDSVRALVEGIERTGLEPHVSDYLVVGEAVEVIDGPFRGLRGTLVDVRGATRVVVRLGVIRQALGVQMERRYLRPLKKR